jgi:hypothetical protein
LVSLTRKRFASRRFRSCDESVFEVNFLQAGFTPRWIGFVNTDRLLHYQSAQTSHNPV